MSSSSSTLPRTRRKRTKVDILETIQALGYLMEARDEKGITPQSAIAPSACHLLILNGWEPGRASYVLHKMAESHVIRPMEHSYKYEILRHEMYIKDFPKYEPPQAQEPSVQPAPMPPRSSVPTPRDLAPRFMAARENTDIVLLKHRLEGAMRSADKIGHDLARAQEENERLQGELSQLRHRESSVDARISEAEARADVRVAAAEARANEASSRALTAQSQLDTATQLLTRYQAYKTEVTALLEMFPKL